MVTKTSKVVNWLLSRPLGLPSFGDTAPQPAAPDTSGVGTLQAALARQASVKATVPIVVSQRIWDEKRAHYGLELYDRAVEADGHCPLTDARMLAHALCLLVDAEMASARRLFIHCTVEGLSSVALNLLNPAQTVLHIETVKGDDPEHIAAAVAQFDRLGQKGFRFCFGQRSLAAKYAAWRPYASFFKVDIQAKDGDQLQQRVQLASRYKGARVIVTHIENQEQWQMARALGAQLFQGFLLDEPVVLNSFRVRPQRESLMRLIEHCQGGGTLDAAVSVFLSDPVLTFALLRFVRTTGLKVAKDVVGIRQGLAVMGLSTLRLWAENMLDFAPPAADETRRLATSAMDRGRLMVALTLHQEQHNAEHQEWAYAVGFMSVLEQALGVSMSNVVQALQLPVVPAQALVRRVGSLGMLLSLAVAAESGDYEIVEQIAPRMGMTRAVVLEHLREVQRFGGRDNSRASLA